MGGQGYLIALLLVVSITTVYSSNENLKIGIPVKGKLEVIEVRGVGLNGPRRSSFVSRG